MTASAGRGEAGLAVDADASRPWPRGACKPGWRGNGPTGAKSSPLLHTAAEKHPDGSLRRNGRRTAQLYGGADSFLGTISVRSPVRGVEPFLGSQAGRGRRACPHLSAKKGGGGPPDFPKAGGHRGLRR